MPTKQIKKIVYSQDADLKRVPKKSGETSINLSREIAEFIYPNLTDDILKTPVSFLLHKDDFLKGIAFVMSNLPLYRSSSKDYEKVEFSEEEFKDLLSQVDGFFGGDKTRIYTVNLLLRRDDGRIYLNGLKQGSFSLRNFLVQESSLLVFERTVNGQNELRILYGRSIEEKESESLAQGSDTVLPTPYRQYITAIKSKPFLLLAGISGTGKSRIVRELARSCWDKDSEEYKAQKPRNFEMIQVKPNWHDSSELFGYVSRINGVSFVVGPFLKFMVKALKEPDVPYFLCLDEMNLAPVEQYFAEYLSVIESRKLTDDGSVVTDPIVDFEATAAYHSLISELFPEEEDRKPFLVKEEEKGKRLSIPPNLIVVGTVNMDETTFSFSRKVLDRAMTIEMNEVDLWGGLTDRHEPMEQQSTETLIGTAVEGVDVYADNQAVCDTCLNYLQSVNEVLEETPFKVAYRTRNEVLLYVVNNLPYNKSADGTTLPQEYVVARALDEITNMKILSRIEGDESKVRKDFLKGLETAISEGLASISGRRYGAESVDSDEPVEKSVSLAKLSEMKKKLEGSGYTSYWS